MQRLIQEEEETTTPKHKKNAQSLWHWVWKNRQINETKTEKNTNIHTHTRRYIENEEKRNAFVFHFSFLFADSYASIINVIVFFVCVIALLVGFFRALCAPNGEPARMSEWIQQCFVNTFYSSARSNHIQSNSEAANVLLLDASPLLCFLRSLSQSNQRYSSTT